MYEGFYLILGAVLYSIQLYTDFAGCVCIATGSAQMFGICLKPNFTIRILRSVSKISGEDGIYP